MLQKNVTAPSTSGFRFFLTVLAVVGALMVAAKVGQAIMVESAYPSLIDVTVTVTPNAAAAPSFDLVPSDYDACMDRAVHHEELRPMRCCRPDETCTVLEPTKIVDFTSH